MINMDFQLHKASMKKRCISSSCTQCILCIRMPLGTQSHTT